MGEGVCLGITVDHGKQLLSTLRKPKNRQTAAQPTDTCAMLLHSTTCARSPLPCLSVYGEVD